MKRLAILVCIACLSASTTGAGAGPREDLTQFAEAAKAGLQALQRNDLVAADAAFTRARTLGPQRPRILYELALVATKRGEFAKAVAYLRHYADFRVGSDDPVDADFAALKNAPGFADARAAIAANRAPICTCVVYYSGTAEPFIAEGVARDERSGRLFVGGVQARRIVAISNGRATNFVEQLPAGLSPFGMAVDAKRGLLWVSSAVLPQSAGAGAKDFNKSALLSFDLASGKSTQFYTPSPDGQLDLGDIALAPDGTVFVSDSLASSLYRLPPGARTLARFGPANWFSSAQGMSVRPDGKVLLVADYEMGLMRIDLAAAKPTLSAVQVPQDTTTIGIDGLARLFDGSFLATQNAFKHPRTVRFHLSPDWTRLESLDVVAANTPDTSDPTLIAAEGTDAYLVGVSQWASFADDKSVPVRPLKRWKVVRLDLR